MKNAYVETLDKAYIKLSDRQTNFGPEAARFERLSKLASIMLNKPISMYDAAMILHCDKMARLQENRTENGSYVDGINYLALASEFAANEFSIETAVEDDIKAQTMTSGSIKYVTQEEFKSILAQNAVHPYAQALNDAEEAARKGETP